MAYQYTKEMTLLTQGLLSEGGTKVLQQGLPATLLPRAGLPTNVRSVISSMDLRPGQGDVTLFDTAGNQVMRGTNGLLEAVDLGGGSMLKFLSPDGRGLITGSPYAAFPTDGIGALEHRYDNGLATYTGSDMRVAIELADGSYIKQLLELTTLTVSIHRVKYPVPAAGYINTKGFSRGRRTIAGTLVLTKFTAEVLFRFLTAGISDKSKDSVYTKIDQLPSFNFTILFSDEWGHASYQRLLRVELVTDGTVYSIQDMLTEQTVSYLAADLTPMLPLSMSSLLQRVDRDPATDYERTPGSCMAAATSRGASLVPGF